MLTKEQYLQICAMEEAAEVTQRISKALRFGLDEVQPGQELTNRLRLEQEIVDFVTVLDKMEELGIIDLSTYENAFDAKSEKIDKYMQYAREQGTLEP